MRRFLFNRFNALQMSHKTKIEISVYLCKVVLFATACLSIYFTLINKPIPKIMSLEILIVFAVCTFLEGIRFIQLGAIKNGRILFFSALLFLIVAFLI